MPNWTDHKALQAQVRKLWDRGLLLTTCLDDAPFSPRRLTFVSPSSRELADSFDAARQWIAALRSVRGVRIEYQRIQHRQLGENQVPVAAWLDSVEDAAALLGEQRALHQFREQVAQTRETLSELLPWLGQYPLKGLALAPVWPQLLTFIRWLREHPRPGVYLRQISLPGIDSKFIEQHRATLLPLLELALSPAAIDATAKGAAQFECRYGFASKPLTVRCRLLDPPPGFWPSGEFSLSTTDFAKLDRQPTFTGCIEEVFITENEINFLAMPPVQNALAIFGAGYGFEALTGATWLEQASVHYWGDLDSHGFLILDQLRSLLPHTRSLLMDEATLVHHRAFWGRDPQPQRRQPSRLTGAELRLYHQLLDNHFGHQVRLEQERIPFTWLEAALLNRHSTPG